MFFKFVSHLMKKKKQKKQTKNQKQNKKHVFFVWQSFLFLKAIHIKRCKNDPATEKEKKKKKKRKKKKVPWMKKNPKQNSLQ